MTGYILVKLAIRSWTRELKSFFSVPEIDQVIDNSYFETAFIIKLGIKACPILETRSNVSKMNGIRVKAVRFRVCWKNTETCFGFFTPGVINRVLPALRRELLR